MLLDDFKKYLDDSGKAEGMNIFLNYDSSQSKDAAVVLQLAASSVSDIGEKTLLRVTVKSELMRQAQQTAGNIYNLFYPEKQYQQIMNINGVRMYISGAGVPYYLNRDASGRHCFVFDLNIVKGRS